MRQGSGLALGGHGTPVSVEAPIVLTAVFAAGLYYLGARMGFALTPPRLPMALLWPPNSLLLAVLLLVPMRQWWVVLAAVFPAHLAAQVQSGVPTSMVLAWFASNCSEAVLGAAAIRLASRRKPRFDSLRDVGMLLAGAALLAPLVSSFVDIALVNWLKWRDGAYWELFRLRATSNVLAGLIVPPLVLAWIEGGRDALRAPAHRYAEAALLFTGLGTVSLAVFQWMEPGARYAAALFYAPLPFMLWAALRLGALGVATANALLAGVALWGVVNELGPFVGTSPGENGWAVQLFLIAATLPHLLLAVVLEDRRRVEGEARAQRQQLAHLSRVATLGGLSGALAHELNQPLTAILANAEAAQRLLAANVDDRRELQDILRDIAVAGRRAADVIRRLRALLKNGDTAPQTIDANELVRETLELARSDFAMRHVKLDVHLHPRPLPVSCDPVQLQQVLLNLVMNAAEAMSTCPVNERVLTLRTSAAENGGVQMSFIDRGVGFSESESRKLFEPFYTTKPQGLGIGLSISRSIVDAHGGRIWATPGKGAAFHLTLPGAAPGHRSLVQ